MHILKSTYTHILYSTYTHFTTLYMYTAVSLSFKYLYKQIHAIANVYLSGLCFLVKIMQRASRSEESYCFNNPLLLFLSFPWFNASTWWRWRSNLYCVNHSGRRICFYCGWSGVAGKDIIITIDPVIVLDTGFSFFFFFFFMKCCVFFFKSILGNFFNIFIILWRVILDSYIVFKTNTNISITDSSTYCSWWCRWMFYCCYCCW